MKTFVQGVLSLLFYLTVSFLVTLTTTSLDNVTVTAMADQDMVVRVYYWNGVSGKRFVEKRSFGSILRRSDQPATVKISLNNSPVKAVRIDFGERPCRVRIFRIGLYSHFFPGREYGPEEIAAHFTANGAVSRFEQQGDHVLLLAGENDPQILLQDSLGRASRMVRYVLPAILAGVFFLILRAVRPGNLAALRLLQAKPVATGRNYDCLDGLRGFAALLVVADHTMGRFTGMGLMGVWIFFTLSGFLLARSFVRQPGMVLDPQYMQTYCLRRMQRILPMYFSYIVIFFLLAGRFNSGLRHLFFLEGAGHLWTIPQEMFFYLLLPGVLIFNYLVLAGRSRLIVIVLLVASFCCSQFLSRDIVRLYGLGKDLKAYVEAFLIGIAASYFYFGVMEEQVITATWLRRILGWTGLVLLCSIPLWPFRPVAGINSFLAHNFPLLTMMLAAVLILLPLLTGESVLSRLLSLSWLRAIGIVGFSYYLLHPKVITLFKRTADYYLDRVVTGLPLFLATGVMTYLLAVLTFSYIEYPFIRPQGTAGKQS